MGNYFSAVVCGPPDTAGKVVLWDGSIQEFSCPFTAAELMLEHPQQVVAEFHAAAVNDKRPIPLPADQKLDVKKVYVMLPVSRGKPTTLASEDARRVLVSATAVSRSKSFLSSSRLFPLLARICPANDHMQEMVQKSPLHEKGNNRERVEEVGCRTELLPESMEGLPEYMNRQYSGKGWKPSLDTIKEKNIERKVSVSHWFY